MHLPEEINNLPHRRLIELHAWGGRFSCMLVPMSDNVQKVVIEWYSQKFERWFPTNRSFLFRRDAAPGGWADFFYHALVRVLHYLPEEKEAARGLPIYYSA
jgi:hypothetical protein